MGRYEFADAGDGNADNAMITEPRLRYGLAQVASNTLHYGLESPRQWRIWSKCNDVWRCNNETTSTMKTT